MATVQSHEWFGANHAYTVYDHDPGTTDATITSPDGGTTKRYVDMRDFSHFTAIANFTTGSGGVTVVSIVAADDTSGTNETAIVTSATLDADALGDFIKVECTAEQIAAASAAAGYTLRYVGAKLTCANSADEALVVYLRSQPKFAYTGLTAASSIA